MLQQISISLAIFYLGAIFGSFASAIIYRLYKEDAGFWHKRSHCIWCKHELGPKNLIPIFSYIWQRGKCAYCKKKIDFSYLLNEILVGLLFLDIYIANQYLGFPEGASYYLFFGVAFFGYLIASYDAKYQKIPDLFSFIFIAGCLALGYLTVGEPKSQLIGIIIGGGFFGLQFLVSRGRWIGSGDILLGIAMGALLGWQATIVALVIAYVSGSIIGVALLANKKLKRQAAIAFGPFLMFGTYLAFFFGNDIYNWYIQTNLIGF